MMYLTNTEKLIKCARLVAQCSDVDVSYIHTSLRRRKLTLVDEQPAHPPMPLEALALRLPFINDPISLVSLLLAFGTASSLRKITLEQIAVVDDPWPKPWNGVKLPQVRELSLVVRGFNATIKVRLRLVRSPPNHADRRP